MNDIKLETERLILRTWNKSDRYDLMEGLNDIKVTKWKGYDNCPYTLEDIDKVILLRQVLYFVTNRNYQNIKKDIIVKYDIFLNLYIVCILRSSF